MKDLLRTVADRLFQAEDTVCWERARLVTEAYAAHADEPPPMRRALAFRHVLEEMTLDVASNPLFAGNTSSAPRAWMLVPEFGWGVDAQIALEHETLRGLLDDRIPAELRSFWQSRSARHGSAGLGHLGLDLDAVVNRGLEGMLSTLRPLANEGSEAQRVYRRAMVLTCEAVIAWAHRLADAADAAAARAATPQHAACHRRVAEACRHVPAQPARTLFEGLQSILLVHLAAVLEGQGLSLSIGLPDRALRRFAAEAASSPSEAAESVAGFLLAVAANSYQGRGSKTQAVTIGGATAAGDDACNAVTTAFLEGFAQVAVADPHLFVRWHPKLDQGVWRRSLSMLAAGRSMPLLVNDAQVVPGLLEAGVAAGDAWDYCIIGCNELGIPGRCCQSALSLGLAFNDLAVLDETLRATPDGFASTQDIVAAYAHRIEDKVSAGLPFRRRELDRLADDVPFPFCSACCQGCADAGDDLLRALPYRRIFGCYLRGTTNATNALAVIEQWVFQEKSHRLDGLLRAVDAGDENVRRALADVPKWGNDEPRADRWGVALNAARDAALRRVAASQGLPPFAVCHVVRSLHHLDGLRIGATLDGRLAGDPVADSLGATEGTLRKGPTALLNSVLKLNASRWFTGIYNLNLTLVPKQASAAVLDALVSAFFAEGGQELQVNVLSAVRLREAQSRPERFRDLVVRVAGLNARFVELSRREQAELIRRAEGAESKWP